jgi:hypothetical protein
MTEQDPDPNQPIRVYLNRYLDRTNHFDFAVMIKGAWGVGKTHFIDKYIERRIQSNPSCKAVKSAFMA